MVRRRHRWIAFSFALAIAASPATSFAKTLGLAISNMAFEAAPKTLHVGDEIAWTNHDFVAHTVTARDGSFDVTIPAGRTGRITLRHAGAIPFYCRFHPNMTGTLDVAP